MRLMTRLLNHALLILVLQGLAPPPTWAADQANTVLIHFSVDPVQLSGVRDSKGLFARLHDALSIKASSPLDSTINVHIGFRVYQSRSDGMENMGYDQTDPRSVTGSGIYVDLDQGNPLDGRIRDLRFYTFGDQSETEAWDFFRSKVESALAYSMWSSHAFQPGEDNNIPLTVGEVADGTASIAPDGKRMVLEITAETLYRDGSKFGSRTPPEGYHESLETVQIVLSPRAADEPAQQEPEPAPAETPAPAALSPGGVTGVYGIEDGRMVVENIDGQLVFYNGNMPEPKHWKLTPVEGTRYSALYYDTPVEVHFSVDDSGRSFAMTIVQQGTELKLPRKE